MGGPHDNDSEARDPIQVPKLPAGRPDRIWGGPSPGGVCAVCGDSIEIGQLELEVEFAPGGAEEPDRYQVHVRCLPSWMPNPSSLEAAGEAQYNETV